MFAKRLSYLRGKSGKTQKQVAEVIGVSRPAYTAYEKGNRQPDYETLIRLANLFDVTTDYLLGKSDDPLKTEDEELEEFINNVRVWYKDEPESKEEKLKMFKKMFDAFKED